jgi:hypothetical protein
VLTACLVEVAYSFSSDGRCARAQARSDQDAHQKRLNRTNEARGTSCSSHAVVQKHCEIRTSFEMLQMHEGGIQHRAWPQPCLAYSRTRLQNRRWTSAHVVYMLLRVALFRCKRISGEHNDASLSSRSPFTARRARFRANVGVWALSIPHLLRACHTKDLNPHVNFCSVKRYLPIDCNDAQLVSMASGAPSSITTSLSVNIFFIFMTGAAFALKSIGNCRVNSLSCRYSTFRLYSTPDFLMMQRSTFEPEPRSLYTPASANQASCASTNRTHRISLAGGTARRFLNVSEKERRRHVSSVKALSYHHAPNLIARATSISASACVMSSL